MIYRIVGFLKSPAGKVILFGLVAVLAFSLVGKAKEKRTEAAHKTGNKLPTIAGSTTGIRDSPAAVQVPLSSVRREFKPFRPQSPEPQREEKIAPAKASPVPVAKLVHAYEPELVPKEKVSPIGQPASAELPPGLFIPCRLFNGIESSLPETPLVAVVIADVKIKGTILVPKNSEIHGSVRADDRRNRVMTGSTWQIVTPAKKLIRLEGIGLNRDYDVKHDIYGSEDGFAGIVGEKVRQDAAATKGVFIASAVSAVGKLGQQRSSTLLGSEVVPTLGNGVIGGASAVMDRYADMKLQEVAEQKPFIRVAAGTEFYVYTQKSTPVVVSQPEEGVSGVLRQRADLLNQLQSRVRSNEPK